MKKKHFEFAGDLVIEALRQNCFGIASMPYIEQYKYFVRFFTKTSKDFAKEKFDKYIKKNFKFSRFKYK